MTVSDTVPRLDDVLAAREAIRGRLHRTPVLGSATLSELAGARVLLKAELFQKTGSFKPRGVLANLAALGPEERALGVISTSAGNHAQAVAWGAAAEGLSSLLVMWQGVSELKVEATRGYGAEVDLEARSGAEAFERLTQLQEQSGRIFIHPFDHPLTVAGQGTIGLEVLEDVPEADVVVVPVGGAGLVAGITVSVKSLRPKTRVIGVEPELAPSLHEALAVGRPVQVEPRSVADGLGAPFVGELSLAVCRERLDGLVLLSEAEIEQGMRFLYTRAKLACEPAGAAAVAALLAGKIPLDAGETAVAVVSGGNVASETAVAILAGR